MTPDARAQSPDQHRSAIPPHRARHARRSGRALRRGVRAPHAPSRRPSPGAPASPPRAAGIWLTALLALATALGREPRPPDSRRRGARRVDGVAWRRRIPTHAPRRDPARGARTRAPGRTPRHTARGLDVTDAATLRSASNPARHGTAQRAPRVAVANAVTALAFMALRLRKAAFPGRVGAHRRVATPRHAATRRLHIPPVLACVVVLALAATGAITGALNAGGGVADASAPPSSGGEPGVSIMHRMAQTYGGSTATVALPAATAPPAPAPPSLANAPALQAHEIFGFAPYWTLPQSSAFDVAGLTTLAYFSVGVEPRRLVGREGPRMGRLPEPGARRPGDPRPRRRGPRGAHRHCFDQSALDQMAADPTTGDRLGAGARAARVGQEPRRREPRLRREGEQGPGGAGPPHGRRCPPPCTRPTRTGR